MTTMTKSTVKSLAIAMAFIVTTFSGSANAVQFGGQVCMPMSMGDALKGLQWRANGVINKSSGDLWVVCPAPNYYTATAAVALTTVFNSNTTGTVDITCITKANDIFTLETLLSSNYTLENIPAGEMGAIIAEDLPLSDFNTITVSCHLPPGAGISSIVSEVY